MIKLIEDVELDQSEVKIEDEEFSIYDVEIDGCSLNALRDSKIRFDSDGDVRVELKLSSSDILLEHVAEEDIVKYLEEQGYIVKEEA